MLAACGGEQGTEAADRPTVEATLTRERVAVLFAEEEYGAALQEIAPLIDGEDAEVGDLVNAAQSTLKVGDFEGAMALVERALEARLLLNVTQGKVIRLLPPFILTDAEADQIVDQVVELIRS